MPGAKAFIASNIYISFLSSKSTNFEIVPIFIKSTKG